MMEHCVSPSTYRFHTITAPRQYYYMFLQLHQLQQIRKTKVSVAITTSSGYTVFTKMIHCMQTQSQLQLVAMLTLYTATTSCSNAQLVILTRNYSNQLHTLYGDDIYDWRHQLRNNFRIFNQARASVTICVCMHVVSPRGYMGY